MRNIALFSLFICLISNEQVKPYKKTYPTQIHGTLLISLKINDTILMASDSRVRFVLHKSINAGYLDENPKIFRIKDFLISFTGNVITKGILINKIISDFNKADIRKMDFQNTILRFQDYLDKNYPLKQYPDMRRNGFIACGFFKGSPQIIVFTRDSLRAKKSDFTKYVYCSNDKRMLSFIHRYEIFPNCNTMSKVIEKAIYAFAKETNQETTIGGPISIVKILPNNKIFWIQNDFSKNETYTVDELVKSLEHNKQPFTPLIKNGKERIIKSFQ